VKFSVASLLLRKSTSFHYKKHSIAKANLHTVKIPRKCITVPTIDILCNSL